MNHRDRVLAAMKGFYQRVEAGKVEQPKLTGPKRKRVGDERTEHDEQRDVVRWLRSIGCHPVSPLNGSKLSGGPRERAMQWNKLVGLGASAGVPDLLICQSPYVALEMKRVKGGRVSDEQKVWHKRLAEHGWVVVVGNGASDAIEKLRALGYGRAM